MEFDVIFDFTETQSCLYVSQSNAKSGMSVGRNSARIHFHLPCLALTLSSHCWMCKQSFCMERFICQIKRNTTMTAAEICWLKSKYNESCSTIDAEKTHWIRMSVSLIPGRWCWYWVPSPKKFLDIHLVPFTAWICDNWRSRHCTNGNAEAGEKKICIQL